ncbi:hypothetical protein BDZ91DRAFT_740635 [Kalaharituber pfeilii]|nr:hypothetical protein BDZ91DRAFT_740635 [Kalaharituber pfeilii]
MAPPQATTYADFLSSEFFKIVLTDADPDVPLSETPGTSTSGSSSETTKPSSTGGASTSAPDSSSVFYIHKALLANISSELRKHVHNEMKEGKEGVMTLGDVDKETMARFVEWAYTGDYPVEETSRRRLPAGVPGLGAGAKGGTAAGSGGASKTHDKTSAATSLLPHAKLYVLADRFNIPDLKLLSYTRLTDILSSSCEDPQNPTPPPKRLIPRDLLAATKFAFENLPPDPHTTTSSRFRIDSVRTPAAAAASGNEENLLEFLAGYATWALDSLRADPEFCDFVEESAEFARALICGAKPADTPPWTGGGGKQSSGVHSILNRRCTYNTCGGYIACAYVRCSSCSRNDYEVGTEVVMGGKKTWIGSERVRGTRTSYSYTCKWCGHTANHSAHSYLYCRKCNNPNLTYVD